MKLQLLHLYLAAAILLTQCGSAFAGDWAYWRGPEQNGISRELNLPEDWSIDGKNVLWKSEIGGRSTAVILNGKVYVNSRTGDDVNDPVEKINAREQVVCWDLETGKKLWHDYFNVFQTDIAAPRVGWASMCGDTETGNVYVHSVSGVFRCYSGDGKLIWDHSLFEDFGKISGYGGRTVTPFIDEDRIIVSYLDANWGETKGPSPKHTFYAFDKKTGALQWKSAPGGAPQDTIYTNPIVRVLDGQRILFSGNADGGIYAINARTGKKIWGHRMSLRGLNASPTLEEDRVYISHGEDNVDNNKFGRIECLNALTGKSLWRVDGIKAGYTSPCVNDGILYVVSDTGTLHAMDSKTGKQLWEYKIGTVGKGSPVFADGKLYLTEVDGNIHIVKPTREKCEKLSHNVLRAANGEGMDEIYGSAAISNGRVVFVTRDRTICIGMKGHETKSNPIPKLADEKPVTDKVDMVQIRPFEVALTTGETAEFEAFAFDANGGLIKSEKIKLTADASLKGVSVDGSKITTGDVKKAVAGTLSGTLGGVTSKARVRVFPPIPTGMDSSTWSWDFTGMKGKAVPPEWCRAFIKMTPRDLEDGNTVMREGPGGKGRPSHTVFLGLAREKGYMMQADVLMKEQKRKLGSIGLSSHRYYFIIKGNNSKLSLQTWQAHLRLGKQAEKRFRADPDVWYTMKMKVEIKDGKAHVKGKVWDRSKAEPEAWTIEAIDPNPNTQGSPGLYVYGLADCYFDNVKVWKEK